MREKATDTYAGANGGGRRPGGPSGRLATEGEGSSDAGASRWPTLAGDRPGPGAHLAFGALFLVVAFGPSVFYLSRPLHVDEAVFLVAGREIHRGATLYVDVIDHKPPGIFLLAAAIEAPSGEQYRLARLATSLTHAGTAALLVVLGRRLRDATVGMAAGLLFLVGVSLPHFDGYVFLTEPFAVSLTTIAVLFFLDGRRLTDVLAGVALGGAVLFNQTAILLGLPLLGHYALRFWADDGSPRAFLREVAPAVGRLGGGFLLPLTLVGAYVASQGALRAMVRYAVVVPLTDYHTPFGLEGHLYAAVTYLPVWLLAGVALVLVASRTVGGRAVDAGVQLVALWFAVLVVPGAMAFNGDHKLLFAFPPAALLAAIGLAELVEVVDHRWLANRDAETSTRLRARVAVITVVVLVVLGLFVGSNGLYAANLADESVHDQRAAADRITRTVEGPIYTLPFHQELVYFGEGVEPAHVYLGAVYGDTLPRTVIEGLEAGNVTYVVVAAYLVSENGSIEARTGFFPDARARVAGYVEREYVIVAETEQFVVFRRR